MDDYVDSFLSLQSWSELNTSSRSSWTGSSVSHANDVLADTVEAYVEDKNNTSICMIPSAHFIENVNSEDSDLHAHSDNSSAFAGGTLNYLSQPENETRRSNMLLNGVFESNSISGSYNQDLNTLTMTSSVESNASDACKFAQPLRDANSISSVPSMWPPSYSGVSSIAEQVKLQGFDFQGTENNGDTLTKSYAENGNYSYVNSSAASLHDCNELNSSNLPPFIGQQIQMMNGCLQPHEQEQNGMHSLQLPTLSSGFPIMSGKPAGLHAQQQLSLSTEANSLKHQTNHSSTAQEHTTTANTNGTAKPRVRARRGQATDPHSIAERLRREKIADRMKNLQELVPNSNKTDKASMLDEIIDYVKFLQLQVKVLSMSRLGAAGAVLPLITDVQAEGSALLLSESEENIALEQEVVKLMELSVTTAMQYLQNKGLCLMPIALASAISSRKGSSSAAILQGRRKPDGNNLISSERISRENGSHNMFSGGSGMKREEVVKSI